VTQIRALGPEELPAVAARVATTFSGVRPSDEEVEARLRVWEPDRTLGAFDDGSLVATAATIPLPLTLPGGRRVPAAGISRVTVLPTHRRRGLLTEMLRRQIDEAREQGELVAGLFASEGGIYGRFGFGVATLEADLRVARGRSAFREEVDVAGLRLVDRSEAAALLQRIAAKAVAGQPGAVERSSAWWRFAQGPRRRGAAADLEVVVRAEDDGFVAYQRQIEPPAWRGSLEVVLLLALNPAAYGALWRYCLDVDLIDDVLAPRRSADETLRFLLADPRAMECSLGDGLWLRLIDAEAALNARTYADDGRIVIGVGDTFCPWNTGTYAIEGGRCRRTDADPSLVMPADALGACYLGGIRFSTLVRAGVVTERRPGAAERADGLFRSAEVPWCPFHF
jgi:predicted acetyltransferase